MRMDATVRFVTRFWRPVFRFAWNMLADGAQAAAVTEETMFALLESAPPGPARVVVYQSALQFCLLRRRWTIHARDGGTPLRAALQRLSHLDRAALLLRDVEMLPCEEVAQVLRVPLREARQRAHRGRLLMMETAAADTLPRTG